jgi:hypothetical protein
MSCISRYKEISLEITVSLTTVVADLVKHLLETSCQPAQWLITTLYEKEKINLSALKLLNCLENHNETCMPRRTRKEGNEKENTSRP